MLRAALLECRLCATGAYAAASKPTSLALDIRPASSVAVAPFFMQSRRASTASTSTSSSTLSQSSSSTPPKHKKPGPLKNQLRQDRSSRIRQRPSAPDGQAIAFSTAESYDIDALRKALWNKGLLGRGDGEDAVNLMGEAIWVPRWPLANRPGEETESNIASEAGELFIFESGAFVSWNMSESSARDFANTVLRNIDSRTRSNASEAMQEIFTPVEVDKYLEEQTEAMDFVVRNNQGTGVRRDCIIIGDSGDAPQVSADSTIPPLATAIHPPTSAAKSVRPRQETNNASYIDHASSFGQDLSPPKAILQRSESDLRARLTLSRGLARSTKLSVYEEMLDLHMDE